MYIANSTRQIQRIYYRLPEEKAGSAPKMIMIPPGAQVVIGTKWTAAERDYVIEHLDRHGARPVAEIKGRLKHFQGLIYSTDRPVQTDEILIGHAAVMEHAERRSAAEAVKGAAALDIVHRSERGKRTARVTGVEIQQEVPPCTKPTGKEISMAVEISEEGPTLKIPE